MRCRPYIIFRVRGRPRTARTYSSTVPRADNAVADKYAAAFSQNKAWASKVAAAKPHLFPALARGQSPEILWIGCSDSRCPETTILDLEPGDVFVHRNIANVVHPTDLSANAVIEYAVNHLKVKHVVLCGHTSCGGVAAALANNKLGVIDTWLLPLRTLRKDNLKSLESLPSNEAALKLVELNVRNGVKILKENSSVLDAMSERDLKVHGLIYDIAKGELNELDIKEDDETSVSRQKAFKTSAPKA
jgi:carbonic anhydrase